MKSEYAAGIKAGHLSSTCAYLNKQCVQLMPPLCIGKQNKAMRETSARNRQQLEIA